MSIGAVFFQAWTLFRRRFVLLLLLGLLQGASLFLGVFWRDLYYNFGVYEIGSVLPYLASRPYANEVMLAAGFVLLLFAGTAMALLTRQRSPGSTGAFWRLMMRRFPPVLIASALCFGLIGLVFYGWFRLALEILRGPFSQMILIGVTGATALMLIAFASLVFVTLPAAALEAGGPLQALRRSLTLTAGQRWRLGAIMLILLAGLVLMLILGVAGLQTSAIAALGLEPMQYGLMVIGFLLSLFLLILTLVIAAAYHQMVRLKDGVRAEDVGVVFE
ncbi:hypothetical protein GCM10007874_07670 [Labrys miyagiensis]|uniref:FtsX-like permease family protein n=1 Tax=Labrys miyagiensis TaxID=346912 RepID=A0ABQ6CDK4_9HYPH|nr:hypothetical protein [Labrys miyagiensis]GLS17752.1 hypothetical protein GCM10007874_07670 [Labrys miyagiensis]